MYECLPSPMPTKELNVNSSLGIVPESSESAVERYNSEVKTTRIRGRRSI